MLLFQNKNCGFDENHLVSTGTITGQAPAWSRGMVFGTGSLGGSSSGINPIFNKNSDGNCVFKWLCLIFVFLQSFEALIMINLCSVDDQETGL